MKRMREKTPEDLLAASRFQGDIDTQKVNEVFDLRDPPVTLHILVQILIMHGGIGFGQMLRPAVSGIEVGEVGVLIIKRGRDIRRAKREDS